MVCSATIRFPRNLNVKYLGHNTVVKCILFLKCCLVTVISPISLVLTVLGLQKSGSLSNSHGGEYLTGTWVKFIYARVFSSSI